MIRIHPFLLNVTFLANDWKDPDEDLNISDSFTTAFGIMLSSVDRAPIRLNALLLQVQFSARVSDLNLTLSYSMSLVVPRC